MREYLIKRCEDTLLAVLNEYSSALYLLPIDDKEFKLGNWTPKNINHDNVVVRYISRSVLEQPEDPAAAIKVLLKNHPIPVLQELQRAFENHYAKDPVAAHNTAILINQEITRFKAFIEVLSEVAGKDDETVVALAHWVAINPVQVAEDDWR